MWSKDEIKKHKDRTMRAVTAVQFLEKHLVVEWHESWSFCRTYLNKMSKAERIKAAMLYYAAAELIDGIVTRSYHNGTDYEIVLHISDWYSDQDMNDKMKQAAKVEQHNFMEKYGNEITTNN